jgi:SAM-dependent methyltransferase
MNRERGLTGSNGYGRELGLDVLGELRRRVAAGGTVRWLDLCCGSGRALFEAAAACDRLGIGDRVDTTGVDLVGYFDTAPPYRTPVRLVTASVATWTPPARTRFDLITCVHGLHYVGDKLAVLARAVSWLTADGVLAATFDAAGVRSRDGAPLGRRLTGPMRAAGFALDTRSRRVTRRGSAEITLPLTYLGCDDTAGPNYTGQPAVHSYYATDRRV